MVKSIIGQPNVVSMTPFKPLHIKWQCGAGSFFTGRTLKLAHFEDCPLATFAENKRFSGFFFFAKGPIKFRYSTMEPLDTIKLFELTWPLRKQPSNLWMLLVRLQKKLENLLWCNNTIFSQVSPVECLYCTINLYHSSISFLLLTFLFFFPVKVLQTLNVPKLNTTAIPSILKTTKNCT